MSGVTMVPLCTTDLITTSMFDVASTFTNLGQVAQFPNTMQATNNTARESQGK